MINKKLLTLLVGSSLLLTTACSSENVWDYDGSQSFPEDDLVEVSFTLSQESSRLLTRDDNSTPGGPGQWQTLGRGSQIDMLIYAVYDADLKLLSQYSQGVIDDTQGKLTDYNVSSDSHFGQTIRYVGNAFANDDKVNVTMRLMRSKTYTIAFWAQSSQTKAYDTNNLRHVEVKYDGAVNNDETRDVFCKAETFTVTDGGIHQDVILTRPVAQINVGTTGADYKDAEIGTTTGLHLTVKYSKIEIKGVARYLDVVKNKVLTQTDIEEASSDTDHVYKGVSGQATATATFDWAQIPAYYKTAMPSENLYVPAKDEEFLQIDLDQDGKILDYKTSYPTLGSAGSYMTEQFKYLSMCYVLVNDPSTSPDDDLTGISKSKVLDNVTVWFANNEKGDNGNKSLDITQVPARTNWRTNILGGLKWMQDPTDGPVVPNPDDPNDPTDPDNPYDDPDYPGPNDPNDPDNPNPPTPPIPPGGDDTTIFNSARLIPTIVSDYLGENPTVSIEDEEKE